MELMVWILVSVISALLGFIFSCYVGSRDELNPFDVALRNTELTLALEKSQREVKQLKENLGSLIDWFMKPENSVKKRPSPLIDLSTYHPSIVKRDRFKISLAAAHRYYDKCKDGHIPKKEPTFVEGFVEGVFWSDLNPPEEVDY